MPPSKYITASLLYNYLQCPHRVWRDIYGPQEEKNPETNKFVEMLWRKGVQHEANMVEKLGEFVNMGEGSLEDRFQRTVEAMKNGVSLIYQGVIRDGNLLGIPDLLKRMPDGMYMAVDIKSGMGIEGADDDEGEPGKPKKPYAVQLCLYTDVLQRLGFSSEKRAVILDGSGNEVEYDLMASQGVRTKETWWELYERIRKNVELLVANQEKNKPAMSPGTCKMCPWYGSCKQWCEKERDPTLLFELGRSKRDVLCEDLEIATVDDLLEINIDEALEQKKKEIKAGNKGFLKGFAENSLSKILRRAKIMYETGKPVLYAPLSFPEVEYELFFDIEADPTQEFVYLHGVYERRKDGQERFLEFTAREVTRDAEREAWARFWAYIDSLPEGSYSVYYYSSYEKTTYKAMQKKYPDVISAEKVEAFFANPNVIDLYYGVVLKSTDWPVGSYSIKPIAQYLGFKWRDENPSGAMSIEWFNQYVETGDTAILQRILDYNEDDCKATMVLKDGLVKMNLSQG